MITNRFENRVSSSVLYQCNQKSVFFMTFMTDLLECCCCLLSPWSVCLYSVAPARQQNTETGTCTGSTKGQACNNRALPFTQHCFQRILSTTSLIVQLVTTSAEKRLWFCFIIENVVLSILVFGPIRWCTKPVCDGVPGSHSLGLEYCVISFIVLCRHSVESFPAALC